MGVGAEPATVGNADTPVWHILSGGDGYCWQNPRCRSPGTTSDTRVEMSGQNPGTCLNIQTGVVE